MAKLTDALLSKVAGKKIETIKIPTNVLVDMIDRLFIVPAPDDDALDQIEKVCSKHLINVVTSTDYKLESLDKRHELLVHVGVAGSIAGNYVWVHDMQTNQYFEMEKSKHLKTLIKEIEARIKNEKLSRSVKTTAEVGLSESNIEHKDTYKELTQMKALYDQGIITQEEFEAKKKQILGL